MMLTSNVAGVEGKLRRVTLLEGSLQHLSSRVGDLTDLPVQRALSVAARSMHPSSLGIYQCSTFPASTTLESRCRGGMGWVRTAKICSCIHSCSITGLIASISDRAMMVGSPISLSVSRGVVVWCDVVMCGVGLGTGRHGVGWGMRGGVG